MSRFSYVFSMSYILSTVFCVTLLMTPTLSHADEARTTGRTVTGITLVPQALKDKPMHWEFLPYTSLHDAQHDHPEGHVGQDWDTSKWPKPWTGEMAAQKFFENGTFYAQYMRDKRDRHSQTVPVLEVGPTFYKLSTIDQGRSLKLLSEVTHVFDQGFKMIQLVDWRSKKMIGSYTPRNGLSLY